MTKVELIAEISARTKVALPKTETIIDAISEEIIDSIALYDSFVYLDGLGIFWARHENERRAQNPKTGEDIVLPAKRWPTFTAGKPSEYAENTGKKILTNQDLANNFSKKYSLDGEKSLAVINSFTAVLKETMDRGEKIVVAELGVFDSMKYPARSLTDPDTGETCSTQSTRIYTFTSAKVVKERMGV